MISLKTAAIYARRSKSVETGDSIETQIQLCTNYLNNLGITDTILYKDEGFSGKNTDRPAFQRLMEDAKDRKFQIVTCYKLDRVSRNVGDFYNLVEDLKQDNIDFISVIEQFDTNTPMGRAMMGICSVFSELERNTISQRVCDNMYSLAENGYWLGGNSPLGFSNERSSFIDPSGKERSFALLSPLPSELALVMLIFDKYLELGSLSKVEKYLLQNNIKTRKGNDWSKLAVRTVLTNPAYVKADSSVVNYLKSCGITFYGEVDEKHGVLAYKKRKGKNGKLRDHSEWIYAVSNHIGFIDSESWLKVQHMLKANKSKAPTLGCSHNALLSGMIRCAKCGTFMRVCYGVPSKKDGKRKYYYMCTLKHNSGKTRCDNRNVDGPELDGVIINKLKELSIDKSSLIKSLKSYQKSLSTSSEKFVYTNLQYKVKKNKEQIDNLVTNISLTDNPQLVQILLDKIAILKQEGEKLKQSLDDLNEELKIQENLINNCDDIIYKLKNFSTLVDGIDISGKRKLLSSVIDKVFVDGDTGAVKIKFKIN